MRRPRGTRETSKRHSSRQDARRRGYLRDSDDVSGIRVTHQRILEAAPDQSACRATAGHRSDKRRASREGRRGGTFRLSAGRCAAERISDARVLTDSLRDHDQVLIAGQSCGFCKGDGRGDSAPASGTDLTLTVSRRYTHRPEGSTAEILQYLRNRHAPSRRSFSLALEIHLLR